MLTSANSVVRLTLAELTPPTLLRARSTRRTQEAHVIPSISSSIWTGAAVGAPGAVITPS